MKIFLATLLLIGFSTIAFWGFWGIHHLNDMGYVNCLATLTGKQAICPTGNALGFIAFHLEAFRSFLLERPSLLLFVAAFILLFISIFTARQLFLERLSYFFRSFSFVFLETLPVPSYVKVRRWLSLRTERNYLSLL